MSDAPFVDETLEFQAANQPRQATIRTPRCLATHPGLLIALGGAASGTFLERATLVDGSGITPAVFLAAGHRVASFDLPSHGDRIDRYGEGLPGMAAAMADGVDVFGDIRQTGRALIDHCIQRGVARAGGIVVQGISRGGLAALHVMSDDPRVLGCAIHAPVTHLPALREFAQMSENTLVQKSNAAGLIPKLAGRPLFIANGETDPRVGEAHCFELHARLTARSAERAPVLFTGPGQSHGSSYPLESGYQAAAAFLLRLVADHTKLLPYEFKA